MWDAWQKRQKEPFMTGTCNARRALRLRDVAQQSQSGLLVTGIACHKKGKRKTVLRNLKGSQSEPLPTLLFFRSFLLHRLQLLHLPRNEDWRYTGSTTRRLWHATVLRDLHRAHSEPLLAVIFLRSSHSDDWLPQLFGSVRYLFAETRSPFMLSTSRWFCPRSTCERRRIKRKHNASTKRGVHIHSSCRTHWVAVRKKSLPPHPRPLVSKWCCVLLTTVAKLALVEQHRPRREDDRIGHQNDCVASQPTLHIAIRKPYPRNLKSSA